MYRHNNYIISYYKICSLILRKHGLDTQSLSTLHQRSWLEGMVTMHRSQLANNVSWIEYDNSVIEISLDSADIHKVRVRLIIRHSELAKPPIG